MTERSPVTTLLPLAALGIPDQYPMKFSISGTLMMDKVSTCLYLAKHSREFATGELQHVLLRVGIDRISCRIVPLLWGSWRGALPEFLNLDRKTVVSSFCLSFFRAALLPSAVSIGNIAFAPFFSTERHGVLSSSSSDSLTLKNGIWKWGASSNTFSNKPWVLLPNCPLKIWSRQAWTHSSTQL